MSVIDLERARLRLEDARRRAVGLVGEVEDELSEISPTDEIEEADRVQRKVLGHTLAKIDDLRRDELVDIEAALERIADGSYGLCSDCRRPIAPARLAAWPAAQRCEACQEGSEGTDASAN